MFCVPVYVPNALCRMHLFILTHSALYHPYELRISVIMLLFNQSINSHHVLRLPSLLNEKVL
jgi:hypothetical protein